MKENELTMDRLRNMPSWEENYLYPPQNELNLQDIDSKPLWEIEEVVESKKSLRSSQNKIITEAVLHPESPWLKTIDVMNERFYKNKDRAIKGGYGARAVMSWTKKIDKQVDKLIKKGKVNIEDKNYLVEALQERVSNKIYKEVSEAKPERLDELRDKGAGKLLRNVLAEDSRYNPETKRPDPIRRFVESENLSLSEIRPEISQVNSIDKTERVEYRIKHQLSTQEIAQSAAVIFLATFIPTITAITYQANESRLKDQEEIDKWIASHNANKMEQAANINIETLPPAVTPDGFSPLTPPATPEPVSIITEQMATLTQNQTVNVYSASEKTPEPVITEIAETEYKAVPATPEPDYYHAGIDFSNKKQTTIDIAGVTISTIPLVHKDIFNSIEKTGFEASTASGTDKSQIYIDKYGNTIWGIHSGTDKGVSNPGEELRKKIQEGSLKDPYSYLNEAETLANINKLLKQGDLVYVEQEDGTKRAYQVAAVGVIPSGNLNDKFYSDKKNATDNVIEATGGVNSDFSILMKDRGVITHTCLHNVSVDPNDPNSLLIDQTGDTLVIGLVPTEESYVKNEAETSAINQEAETQMHPLEESARTLTQILNSASSRAQDSGEIFKAFLTDQFGLHGIPLTEEAKKVIEDIKRETEDGDKIQCTMGVDLLGAMPGSKKIVMDTYGWQDKDGTEIIKDYNEAVDFITKADGSMDPKLANGGRINRYGADIFKVDSFSDVEVGDKITVPRSPALPNGHVVVVIGKRLDENGKTHLKIFDVNYDRNFGLPRILEDVTEENIFDQIAKGQKLNLFGIRPQEKVNRAVSDNN